MVQAIQEGVTVNAQRAAAAPAFTREAFSEYHLYSLQRRSTLADNETKQIAMLDGTRVPVRKVFVVNGQFTRISPQVSELAYEVTLRNHKAVPITVDVNEPFAGDWTILSSTHQAQKMDAWAARFAVPVAANGEATLRYRVRVRW